MGASSAHWAERARYDLGTARDMFGSRRYLYVLFCCQQAVEKMLKALVAERSRELPPRLHSLVRLAEAASLSVDDEQAGFLRELTAYYIQTRYPEETSDLGSQVNEDEARRVLDRAEETVQWLSSML
jgi:HEPN domain-containing protein